MAYAACLHSALLFSSEIVSTRYKENEVNWFAKKQFAKSGDITKMSFSYVHPWDYILIFMVLNKTLKYPIIVYLLFLKDGVDLS